MNPMKVASYNIRKAVGTDRRRNPGRVLDVINGIEADVVVLQEADRRLGARPTALPFRMIEEHSDYAPITIATTEVSLGWHGNAILVRKGLSVTGARRIDLPGLEPRGAISAKIDGITVMGAHLGLMRRHRHQQLLALRGAVPDGPTLIAGDFNEWSVHKGLEPLQPQFDMVAPGRSFHANRPMAALDRFGLGEGLTLFDAGVVQSRLARRASDHLPIWAKITLPAAMAD